MSHQVTTSAAIERSDSGNNHGSTNKEKSYNLVAESDYKAAIDALQSKLEEQLLVNQSSASVDDHNTNNTNSNNATRLIQRRFLSDCTNSLKRAIHQSVKPIPDEQFHTYVYKARKEQQNAVKISTDQDDNNNQGDLDDSSDEDSSFEFEDDDLVDTVALDQVRKLREQVRNQAKINSEKKFLYYKGVSTIVERELSLIVKQSQLNGQVDLDNDTMHDRNIIVDKEQLLEQKSILIEEMKKKLQSLQVSLQDCNEKVLTDQWERLLETIQEVEQNFIVERNQTNNNCGGEGNEISMLLSQPKSQIDEAILAREEDDDDELELAKQKILFSVRPNVSNNIRTGSDNDNDRYSPQKAFLDMLF